MRSTEIEVYAVPGVALVYNVSMTHKIHVVLTSEELEMLAQRQRRMFDRGENATRSSALRELIREGEADGARSESRVRPGPPGGGGHREVAASVLEREDVFPVEETA
jgi:hypothetical protein